jgi:sporulation-control protein spo0M
MKIKNNLNFSKFIIIFLFICILEILFNLYKYHPFQSVYLNNLVSNNMKTKFEVDTQSLSRSMALRDILNDAGQNEKITIGTSSWTPLENGRSLLKPYDQNRLKFLGTSDKQKADYIYTNYYYEVNPEYVKKYSIPSNFKLLKSFTVDNTIVYSIYKKN